MLKRNMNPPKSCNGTRLELIVTKVYDNLIEYKIITGPGAGEITFMPRIPLAPSYQPIPFRRLQFPLRVCFAMTIKGCSILYVMGGAGYKAEIRVGDRGVLMKNWEKIMAEWGSKFEF